MKSRHRTPPTPKAPQPATAHPPAATRAQAPEPNTPISAGHERTPAEWAWHHRTLVRLRERLLRAHAEHATEAVSTADMLGGGVPDTAQEQTDRDVLWAELGKETDQLFEVDCALQRIRDGTYGFCEQTGHPIAPERLSAIPWTRYALAAAESIEAQSLAAKKHPG